MDGSPFHFSSALLFGLVVTVISCEDPEAHPPSLPQRRPSTCRPPGGCLRSWSGGVGRGAASSPGAPALRIPTVAKGVPPQTLLPPFPGLAHGSTRVGLSPGKVSEGHTVVERVCDEGFCERRVVLHTARFILTTGHKASAPHELKKGFRFSSSPGWRVGGQTSDPCPQRRTLPTPGSS